MQNSTLISTLLYMLAQPFLGKNCKETRENGMMITLVNLLENIKLMRLSKNTYETYRQVQCIWFKTIFKQLIKFFMIYVESLS
jgi:hypothetical protein